MGLFKKRDEVDYSDLSTASAPTSTGSVSSDAGVVWCQSCGGEFRAGSTTTCFDCGGQLGYEPPPDAGDEPNEVEYDLSEWATDPIGDLCETLDAFDVPYVLEGSQLVVRAADEDAVDEFIAGFQRIIDIYNASDGDPMRLPEGIDITEHDLSGWSKASIAELVRDLWAAVVPFALTPEGKLSTPSADDELVRHVLDAIEFPDALPEAAEEPDEHPDLPLAMDVLSDLYIAVDRLKGNARDAKAIEAAIAGVEDLVELSVPYGMDASAQRLRDHLHPMI